MRDSTPLLWVPGHDCWTSSISSIGTELHGRSGVVWTVMQVLQDNRGQRHEKLGIGVDMKHKMWPRLHQGTINP